MESILLFTKDVSTLAGVQELQATILAGKEYSLRMRQSPWQVSELYGDLLSGYGSA